MTWTVTNNFGPVNVHRRRAARSAARSCSGRPSPTGEAQTFTVDVPAGATRLDVAIGNPSDLGADLDLFVRRDGVAGRRRPPTATRRSRSRSPTRRPARTRSRSTATRVPAGTTAYDYRDVFFSPALGTVDVAPTPVALGARRHRDRSPARSPPAAAPAAGRALFGEMTVVTDQGAVVGRGSVSIGSVG